MILVFLSCRTDLQNAVKKGMPYKFTHFLYWCKMFKNGEEFQHIDSEDEWFEGVSRLLSNMSPILFMRTIHLKLFFSEFIGLFHLSSEIC